jgi:hypothetical protein
MGDALAYFKTIRSWAMTGAPSNTIAVVIKAISPPAMGAISGPGGRNGHRRRPDMR